MSEANIIREFLVRLGFKVDEGSRKKFEDGVQGATVSATKLATAVAAASLAIGKMVASVSKDFEDLYFSAKKAGSSAESMQALGQAAESFGVSAGQAKASAHSLFMTLQKNPGTEGIFKSLGIQTRDAKGQLLDTEKLMMGFFAKAKKMPSYLAYQYGGMLGISDDMLQAGMQDGFSEKELQRRLQSTHANSAAEAGHKEQEGIRDAQATYLDWMQKVNDQLPPFVKELGAALGVLASFVSSPVMAALGALGVTKLLTNEAAKKTAETAAKSASGGGFLGWAASKLKTLGILATTGTVAYEAATALGADKLGEKLGGDLYDALHPDVAKALKASTPLKASASPADKKLARGIRNNNPGNLNFAGQRGATKEAGPSGRFAVFDTPEEGLRALIHQIDLYAKRGVNNVQGIIGKWAPENENNTRAYIERVSRSLGVDPTKPLDISNIQTRTGLMKAIIGHENGKNPYTEAQIAGAASGVNIAQTTTINVNGASDPVSTAQAVAQAQNSVNAATMRNAATRVQ